MNDKKNLYHFHLLSTIGFLFCIIGCGRTTQQIERVSETPSKALLLKNWMPESIYEVPVSNVKKARYPVIDMHEHQANSMEELSEMISAMDSVGIEKSVIYTRSTGAKFDSIYKMCARYSGRFLVYCGFDFSDFPKRGWEQKAIKELQRCAKEGAVGVGEITDKGSGLDNRGIHPDDPRMDSLFDICAKLHLPITLHVADPIWNYKRLDSTNDRLIRSATWQAKTGDSVLDYQELMQVLENTIKRHPDNTFDICHLANSTYNLSVLARLFDKYSNFYTDISARYPEFSTIPRYASDFFAKYSKRLLYGTDYNFEIFGKLNPYGQQEPTLTQMFRMTFRVLETPDEHFYMTSLVQTKWPMNGLALSDTVLQRIYRNNAIALFKRAGSPHFK